MKRTQGMQVFVKGFSSNGTDTQTAVVTRVWGDIDGSAVNLAVFPDCGAQTNLSSVTLYDDEASADSYIAERNLAQAGAINPYPVRAAFINPTPEAVVEAPAPVKASKASDQGAA